jgi:adenosylcobinamide kinase/adenosylcobinamide-phosphate guanylyltransferase
VVADPPTNPDQDCLPHPALQLVLGPARSGKSRWAEQLAMLSQLDVVYVATGPALPHDDAWQERLRRHRGRRPPGWTTIELEQTSQLGPVLLGLSTDQVALVDSLGSWVASALSLDQVGWESLSETLLSAMVSCSCALVIVSEQTGWGVVPSTAVGGLFRDRLGSLERRCVALAGRTWLVVAGKAVNISAIGQSVPLD